MHEPVAHLVLIMFSANPQVRSFPPKCCILISSEVRFCAIFPNYSESMHCLEGSQLWQEFLGDHLLSKKNVCVKNSELFLLQKILLVSLPQKNQTAYKAFTKKQCFISISTNFQGAGPWEGPVHYLVGLFSGITIAANFSRADPGTKRRKKRLLQKQLRSSKSKPCLKESNSL